MDGSIPSPTAPDMTNLEQAALLKAVVQSVTEYSIMATDLDGSIMVWNQGSRRIFGYEPEEVIGKSAFILADAERPEGGHVQESLRTLHTDGRWSGEMRLFRKNGSALMALVTIMLRSNADGTPEGFTVICQPLCESPCVREDITSKPASVTAKAG
jgi:two-component system, sporulation sensor kinase E